MRILVATDQWFPDRMGGVARVATDTARGWAERGHEVVVIAPRQEGESAEETQVEGALRLLRVLPRGRLPQTLTDPIATRRSATRLAGSRFDVLVGHCSTTAQGLLTARLGAPLVYVFHADAALEARYLREQVGFGRRWLAAAAFERRLRSLTTRALSSASRVIVLSEFSRDLLSRTSPEAAQRSTLVPGGVDTERFSPAGRDEARDRLELTSKTTLVFTVRRLEPRMGLENLFEAVRLLGDEPALRVVVAGGGGDRAHLVALRDRLGLRDRLELVGRVADDELALWHRAADLFVLPTVAYEGFGLVTAEALACGTPVVGTRVGATPELLEPLDSGLLARSPDPRDLAEAIRRGLRLARPEFREVCRDYAVSRLSWEAVLPRWEQVLQEAALSGASVRAAAGTVGRTMEDV